MTPAHHHHEEGQMPDYDDNPNPRYEYERVAPPPPEALTVHERNTGRANIARARAALGRVRDDLDAAEAGMVEARDAIADELAELEGAELEGAE